MGTKMGSTAGNDQNTLCMIFYAKIWNKMQKTKKKRNWFRNFQMTCNARKTLWMALHARKLETDIVKIRS